MRGDEIAMHTDSVQLIKCLNKENSSQTTGSLKWNGEHCLPNTQRENGPFKCYS